MGTILRSKLIWGLLVGVLLGPLIVPDAMTVCDPLAAIHAFYSHVVWGGFLGLTVGLILDSCARQSMWNDRRPRAVVRWACGYAQCCS